MPEREMARVARALLAELQLADARPGRPPDPPGRAVVVDYHFRLLARTAAFVPSRPEIYQKAAVATTEAGQWRQANGGDPSAPERPGWVAAWEELARLAAQIERRLTFGEWLRLARDGAGLGQEALATAVGSSARTIRRWEAGEAEPNSVMRWALVARLIPYPARAVSDLI